MFEMNDEIAFVQFAEIDLRAIAAERSARCKRRRPCVGKRPNNSAAERTTRFPSGKQKPRGKRSFDQIDIRRALRRP